MAGGVIVAHYYYCILYYIPCAKPECVITSITILKINRNDGLDNNCIVTTCLVISSLSNVCVSSVFPSHVRMRALRLAGGIF